MEDHAGDIRVVLGRGDKYACKGFDTPILDNTSNRIYITFMNFRELNLGVEQLVIRLTGMCKLPRITGRRGKRVRWRW